MSNNELNLKPVIDEAAEHETGADLPNELGVFHTSNAMQTTGIVSHQPSSKLPAAELGNFMQRLTKITQGIVQTGDTPLSVIAEFDPWNLFLNDIVIFEKTSNFKYIRSTLEVQLSVNAPVGTYGLYYLIFRPNGVALGGINGFANNPYVVEQMPHIKIDLANSTDGKITLPFIHWNDYAELLGISTDTIRGNWTAQLWCYRPLGTGTGTEVYTASYKVYARCTEDCELVIPYAQMKKAESKIKASGVANTIAKGAGIIGGLVPHLAPYAKPISAVASGVGSILGYFGFTRTSDPQTPTIIVPRPFSNVANMDAYDTSEVAALSKDNSISFDPTIMAPLSQDEGAFGYLFQKWTLIRVAHWSLSDASNDDICNIPVSPFVSALGTAVGATFPVAGFVGLPFAYWRGTMEYKLVIPMSKFHRGVIQVSWAPSMATLESTDITNVRFNQILDVGTQNTWEFSIGYANQDPMLETFLHTSTASIISLTGCNGVLNIKVVNPLISQSETASTDIFIFARAADDMKFGTPRTFIVPTNADGSQGSCNDFNTSIRLQGALGDQDIPTTSRFVLVPSTTFDSKSICVGEDVQSVRALMQKFSQNLNYSRNRFDFDNSRILTTHTIPWPCTNQSLTTNQVPTITTAANSQVFTWAGYYSALYVGLASSVRYKFLSQYKMAFAVNHLAIPFGVDCSAAEHTINSVSPTWAVDAGNGVEITVPYYFNRKYILTRVVYSLSSILTGVIPGRINEIYRGELETPPESLDYTGVQYVAYGPDLRLHMFRFTPAILTVVQQPNPILFGRFLT
jgi:hypothetical protein